MTASSQVLPVSELSLVGNDTARQRTKILPHAGKKPPVRTAVSVFVHSVSIPGHAAAQLGLRYEPLHLAARRRPRSCSQSASGKASGAVCLVLRQPILRPGGSETSVERLSLSWVRRGPERGKAPQLHRIQASPYFCFLDSVDIGHRNPLQDLTPLPIRAVWLLWSSPPLVQS